MKDPELVSKQITDLAAALADDAEVASVVVSLVLPDCTVTSIDGRNLDAMRTHHDCIVGELFVRMATLERQIAERAVQ